MVAVGCVKFLSTQKNDSFSVNANVTYMQDLTKMKVKSASNVPFETNNKFSFQIHIIVFVEKTPKSKKYVKLYDFELFECYAKKPSLQIDNPMLNSFVTNNNLFKFSKETCPIEKGRADVKGNITAPTMLLFQRALKINIKNTAVLLEKNEGISVYNCTIASKV